MRSNGRPGVLVGLEDPLVQKELQKVKYTYIHR